MNEQLIKEYLLCIGGNIFPEFNIDIVCDTGGVLIFKECEPEQFGAFEQHTVNLFDIVSWVYANRKDV